MLFRSFEIMPNVMRVLGMNLPLSLAIDSLEKMLIYGVPAPVNNVWELIVYAVVFFSIAYVLIKRSPTA